MSFRVRRKPELRRLKKSWRTIQDAQEALGKEGRVVVRYSGTAPEYRERCDEVAAGGYRELHLE